MANRNPPADTESEAVTSPSPSPTTARPSSSPTLDHRDWKEAQDSLKRKLVTEDDFAWKLQTSERESEGEEEDEATALKYVGGVDISFSKEASSSSMACGTLVVLELRSLRVVYEDFALVDLRVPYVPGFLAFREAPVLLELLEGMKINASPFYPQLHHVDGLTLSGVKELLKAREHDAEDFFPLTGDSGRVWGVVEIR